MTITREHHRDAALVGCRNHLRVTNGAARLNDGGGSGVGEGVGLGASTVTTPCMVCTNRQEYR